MARPGARLEVVAGNAVGTMIQVEDELLIGRQARGPGQLANDEEISRSHARIAIEPSGICTVEDLQSTNGTYVNGLRLGSPQALSVGDTIELGRTTLVVRELPATDTPSAPPSTGGSQQPTIVPRSSSPQVPRTPAPAGPPEVPGAPVAAGPPEAPAAPEPFPPTAPHVPDAPAAPPDSSVPRLSVQLEVDYEARSATVSFGGGLDPLHIAFEHGAWRIVGSQDGK